MWGHQHLVLLGAATLLVSALAWLVDALRGVALRFMHDLGFTPKRRASIGFEIGGVLSGAIAGGLGWWRRRPAWPWPSRRLVRVLRLVLVSAAIQS